MAASRRFGTGFLRAAGPASSIGSLARLLAIEALVLVLALGPARPAGAYTNGPSDATPSDNGLIDAQLTGLIATLDVGVVLGLVPFWPVSVVGEDTEWATNLGLKFVPPKFEPPPSKTLVPAPGSCTYDFFMPQTRDDFDTWFGFWILDDVAPDWGVLGRPLLRHENSSVELEVEGDELQAGQVVHLDEGEHVFHWTAATQFSPLLDSIIPAALIATGQVVEAKYGAAVAAKAAKAGVKEAKTLKKAGEETLVNLAKLAGIRAVDYGLSNVLDRETSATNTATQTITVYDVHTPVIHASGKPETPLEATDLGGTRFLRVEDELRARLDYYDPCQKPVTLENDAPPILPIGTTRIHWTVSDGDVYEPGVPDHATWAQDVVVQDTQPPLLMPPPGFVRELPAGVDSLPLQSSDLGMPRVIDLEDPEPTLVWSAPAQVPVDTRQPVTWTATDSSGNRSKKLQWVTVKRAGTNTAPTADSASADTVTSRPVDIRLEGVDPDVLRTTLPGGDQVDMSDPLGFEIVDPPAHGSFVAPLRPVFIEDFRVTPVGETEKAGVRTSPLGDYAAEFAALPPGQVATWLRDRGCGLFGNQFPVNLVYEPTYVHVTDDGIYYVRDYYWDCSGDDRPGTGPAKVARISKWSRDRKFLGQLRLGNANEIDPAHIFSVDRDGGLWWIVEQPTAGGTAFTLHTVDANFENPDTWTFGISEQDRLSLGRELQIAHADPDRGLLYVHDGRGVEVYDLRSKELLGRLTVDGEKYFIPQYVGGVFPVPCADPPQAGSIRAWLDTDSHGNVYVSSACGNRIFKFGASGITPQGEFQAGAFVGWMGRCSANVPPYSNCDEAKGVSRGFSCTDTTCLRDGGTAGSAPGQFSWPGHINIDPNDQIYVADSGNLRVQRFDTDGTFEGQAHSNGTGINQGQAPDFVLGNMGPPAAVSVNSSSFFVLEAAPTVGDFFLHRFDGLPFRPIEAAAGSPKDLDHDGYEDDAVMVRYVPHFDFPNGLGEDEAVDQFQYRVSDGLAKSPPATVSIDVKRAFRPPEKLRLACYEPGGTSQIPCAVDEDHAIDVELEARDPDGVVGFGGLDTLRYAIQEAPQNGILQLVSRNAGLVRYRFTPDPDYNGEQTLRYSVSDGVYTVDSEALPITVRPVDDDPVFQLVSADAARGFPASIAVQITDPDADPNEPLPDHLSFHWGPITEQPGELVKQPDGTYATTGALVMPTGPGRYLVQASPVLPQAGVQALSVDWQYDPDGVHDGVAHSVVLGTVQVLERSELGLSITPSSPDPAAGGVVQLDLTVRNPVPQGWGGDSATGTDLVLDLPPELAPQAASAPCNVSGQRIDCPLGTLAPGEERDLTAQVRVLTSGYAPMVEVTGTLRATDSHGASTRMAEATLLPHWVDTDGDGLPDTWERAYGLGVGTANATADPDGDGVDNLAEYQNGTMPVLADSDMDGLDDGTELNVLHSDPLNADTDGDGMPDGWEHAHGLNVLVADAFDDADGDGVNNRVEFERGTDPQSRDSNGDGIDDGVELARSGGFVAVTGGRSSVLFDDAALANLGLQIESTSSEVVRPGSLGGGSLAFPINGRGEVSLGEPTTFLFSPADFAASVGGVIAHVGVVNARDEAARPVDLGDLVLRYAPERVSKDRSGFFLESTTGSFGPVFDLSNPASARPSPRDLQLDAHLLVTPEFANALGRRTSAGQDVGRVHVHAVPEPARGLLALAALATLAGLRRRRGAREMRR
jgi:hypothetical protein